MMSQGRQRRRCCSSCSAVSELCKRPIQDEVQRLHWIVRHDLTSGLYDIIRTNFTHRHKLEAFANRSCCKRRRRDVAVLVQRAHYYAHDNGTEGSNTTSYRTPPSRPGSVRFNSSQVASEAENSAAFGPDGRPRLPDPLETGLMGRMANAKTPHGSSACDAASAASEHDFAGAGRFDSRDIPCGGRSRHALAAAKNLRTGSTDSGGIFSDR